MYREQKQFKIFALDGPWGPSSGNNNRGSGGFSGGNNDSIDDLLKDLKNKYKIKMPFKGGFKGVSFLLLIAFVIWLATGFYRVEPDEQGVELYLENGTVKQQNLDYITFFQLQSVKLLHLKLK